MVPYKPRQGLTDIAGADVLFFGKQIGMHLDIVRVEASLVLPTSTWRIAMREQPVSQPHT